MNESELQQYLHAHIPQSRAMQVTVAEIGIDSVVLRAPLAPNINHRDTLFGGSASAVAMLTAWSLVQTRLLAAGISGRIVIRRNSMDFERPVSGDFAARAFLDPSADWPRFIAMLKRVGMARIGVVVELEFRGQVAARFKGEFVAMADPSAD